MKLTLVSKIFFTQIVKSIIIISGVYNTQHVNLKEKKSLGTLRKFSV